MAKGNTAERGYMVLERTATGSRTTEEGPTLPMWVERGAFKAASREKAIIAFLGTEDGQGRTFEAIPESDWNPATLTVKKVEPQIAFKYAKPQRARPRKTKEAAVA